MESICISILCIFLLININFVSSDGTLDKRRPGWGKRDSENFENSDNGFFDEDKRRPGWGKRTLSDYTEEIDKRKPGWGKRSNLYSSLEMIKRCPGWGKRDTGGEIDKRKPGWGKRAGQDILLQRRVPGWGKRDTYLPENLQTFLNKRKPGWGKRSDDIELETRRPGWGKRVPGWGKRSSESETCQLLEEQSNRYINLAVQAEAKRLIRCGGILPDDYLNQS